MKNSVTLLVMFILLWSCNAPPKVEEAAPAKPQPVEIADAKYIGIGKQGLEDLAKGNVDGFINAMAENVTYKWNNGDSITGKTNVAAYWKERRTNLIDTIAFTNDIWLTIKANEPPKNVAPGIYLFGWYDTHVTYKNGQSIKMNIHNVYHLNNEDKIDFVLQYLDRALVNAALAKK